MAWKKAGAELTVPHCHWVAGAAHAVTAHTAVPMTAAGALRGKTGVFPGAEEVKLAAYAWLMASRPLVLEKDADWELRTALNGNAYILWNALKFSRAHARLCGRRPRRTWPRPKLAGAAR